MKTLRIVALALCLGALPALATVSSTTSSASYTGNGSSTAFAVPFPFLLSSDLTVKVGGVTQSLGSAYAVTGAGGSSGTVTFTAAPVNGTAVTIERIVPLTQITAFSTQGSFSPKTHEKAFDKAMMAVQQLERAKVAIPSACPAGQVITSNGSTLVCVVDVTAGGAASDTSTVTATGATTARALRDRFADVVNVRDFGAIAGDGLSDVTAFKAAVAAVAPGGIVRIPVGTYDLDATTTKNNAIQVPDDVSLAGDGYATVLRIRGGTVNSNARHYVFTFGSRTRFRNFQLDGNKANKGAGATTGYQLYGFSPTVTTGTSDLVFEDLWAHDLPGGTAESFWVTFDSGTALPTGNVSNVTYRRLRGYSNEGTPFHVDGSILYTTPASWATGQLTDGVTVEDVESWSNTWMGISVYGAKNVRILGGRFYSNTQNGVNVEWSQNVEIIGVESYGNTRAGIGTFGRANFKARACNIHDNNTGNVFNAGELVFRVGAWYTGSPAPKAVLESAELVDCRVSPIVGQRQVYTDRDATVNVGSAEPDSIIFHQRDSPGWTVASTASGTKPTFPLRYVGLEVARHVPLGPLSGFNLSGATQVTAGGITTFTGTAQFHNFNTQFAMKPGRTYRARFRVRREDALGEWRLVRQEPAGTNAEIAYIMPDATLTSVWQEWDLVVVIPSGSLPYRLQWTLNTASVTSALAFSWVSLEELIQQGTQELSASATWDPASAASGASTSTTVSVGGARIGEQVAVEFSQAVPAGTAMLGQVTAADTVTVSFLNLSGGAVDLASGTLRVYMRP